VWDDAAKIFTVQVTDEANKLAVTNRSLYWAQGGVSMSLQNNPTWQQQAIAEEMPAFDEPRLRSAAVYDKLANLYLIVTETKATVPQFRQAIIDTIAPDQLVDGIFLDGDGSSQLRSKQMTLKGDTRPVYQMIALRRVE